MVQKLVAPLRATRLLLSWLPLKENRWPVVPLPVAFSFGPTNKAAACLGSDQATSEGDPIRLKGHSYQPTEPLHDEYLPLAELSHARLRGRQAMNTSLLQPSADFLFRHSFPGEL